jgi:FkbM family methyltransferase
MNKLKTSAIAVLTRTLPDRVKNSIFHLAYHLALPEFERFAHQYGSAPHMKYGLAGAAKRGLAPRTIVDVGAYQGEWSKLAKQIWPTSRVLMIEPNQANQERLTGIAEELGATLHWELLGADDNEAVPFYVMGSGSSVMNENSPLPRAVETRRLRTLDSLLGQIEPPGFLKIDAQGYELQILKGASKVLPDFEAVLLEIAVIEVNKGAPLLHEVIAFMKAIGFVAYEIVEIHRRPLDQALNQVDIVFIREKSALIADKRHFA